MSVADFPADKIVQVLSDQKAATAALMAENIKSKDFSPQSNFGQSQPLLLFVQCCRT